MISNVSSRVLQIAVVLVLVLTSTLTIIGSINQNCADLGKTKTGTARISAGPTSEYQPASLEQYLVDNAIALGFDKAGENRTDMASGCEIWNNKQNPMYNSAQTLNNELKNYYEKIASFESIPDLRTLFTHDESNRDEVCKRAELDPENGILQGFFNESRQLSYSSSGYIEPLFTPMRHPNFCKDPEDFLNLDYLIHDFGAMCKQLRKTSRIVFFDLGASLNFHGGKHMSPALKLAALYRKFGFPFDHFYAFEIKKSDSQMVFDKVPLELLAAYHWINVGVSPDVSSRNNPWNLLLENYNQDDLIIIKLDVDTRSVEVPLARQLLNNPQLHNLVDHFYFEHHVKMAEIAHLWKTIMKGSVQQSLNLFQNLRKKGIPAHFWV
ncbi:hypothetical protein MHU86_15911 [Fragilaria crotonensis]|nr:hypothetical protein MHU86_15911 [Fragilaria crotonensis]